VGIKFIRDAAEAAVSMPGLLKKVEAAKRAAAASRSLPGEDDDPVVEEGGLVAASVGGVAGGAKAIHREFGLFLKTPDDSEGIYGTMIMAAKVMKLEVNANRYIHGMDSIHVNAPLSTIVDVPYVDDDGVASVQRVQVQAKLAIGGDTLRVGSSDGGDTIHQDETCM